MSLWSRNDDAALSGLSISAEPLSLADIDVTWCSVFHSLSLFAFVTFAHCCLLHHV